MDRLRKIQLQRAIIKLENPYPKDDLILSYSDFVKARDYLGCYQFNPVVFDNLIRLANDEWKSKKRINRLSLLEKTKQYFQITQQAATKDYYSRYTKPDYQFSVETRKSLFELFRKTFEEGEYINHTQLDKARKICNNILINLELTTEEEEWLCANSSVSELILNRVLRYPVKSGVISNWAKNNFYNDLLRSRRAELLSWVIDRQPAFEIDQQNLIDDFEYLNQKDLEIIQHFDKAAKKYEVPVVRELIPSEGERVFTDSHEIRNLLKTDPQYKSFNNALKIVEEKFDEMSLELVENNNSLRDEEDSYQEEDPFHEKDFFEIDRYNPSPATLLPKLKFSKRPYSIPMEKSEKYSADIPDFKMLKQDFYTNLPTHLKVTMIWAIAYSRLDNTLKYSLLKKYYSDETYYSMYRVCKRTKNIELLKWLLENQ